MRLQTTALLLVVGLAGCRGPAVDGDDVPMLAVDGQPAPVATPAAGRIHVVVFTSVDCPIANAYAPALRELATRFGEAPVDWFFVVAEPATDREAARRHAAAYALPGRLVLDPTQRLVRHCGAQKTPEAVVLTAEGMTYRGRIDDAWASLGQRRPAMVHDLSAALARTLAGDRSMVQGPPPVGCFLPPRTTP